MPKIFWIKERVFHEQRKLQELTSKREGESFEPPLLLSYENAAQPPASPQSSQSSADVADQPLSLIIPKNAGECSYLFTTLRLLIERCALLGMVAVLLRKFGRRHNASAG